MSEIDISSDVTVTFKVTVTLRNGKGIPSNPPLKKGGAEGAFPLLWGIGLSHEFPSLSKRNSSLQIPPLKKGGLRGDLVSFTDLVLFQ